MAEEDWPPPAVKDADAFYDVTKPEKRISYKRIGKMLQITRHVSEMSGLSHSTVRELFDKGWMYEERKDQMPVWRKKGPRDGVRT